MIRPRTAWCVLLLVAAAGLGWQQVRWRQAPAPAPVAPASAPPELVDTLPDTATLALAFALAGAGEVPASTEPLRLRALIVPTQGPARALIAVGDGVRGYRVGDHLPGGNLVRRIDAGHVLLWRAGREERLLLAAPPRLFSPISSPTVVRP